MAMPRKRPLADSNQYYVYIWRHHGVVVYVGQGKNNRGRPSCKASWGGRRWELVKLLEESWREIEAEIIPCQSQQSSRELEQKTIKRLKPKYNRAPHYGGFKGMHTPEGLMRIRKAQVGRECSEELKEARRQRMLGNNNLLGHRHSEETKKRLSEAGKGRRPSDLCIQKFTERTILNNINNPPRKGKKCSPEHRRKLSEAARRRHAPKV